MSNYFWKMITLINQKEEGYPLIKYVMKNVAKKEVYDIVVENKIDDDVCVRDSSICCLCKDERGKAIKILIKFSDCDDINMSNLLEEIKYVYNHINYTDDIYNENEERKSLYTIVFCYDIQSLPAVERAKITVVGKKESDLSENICYLLNLSLCVNDKSDYKDISYLYLCTPQDDFEVDGLDDNIKKAYYNFMESRGNLEMVRLVKKRFDWHYNNQFLN